MKKLLLICLTLVLLAGCNKQKEEEVIEISGDTEPNTSYGVANPWKNVDSIDTLNMIAGSNLFVPPVMGVTNEHYSYMETASYTLAEFTFSLNGYDFVFRNARTEEDISGVYYDSFTVFAERTEEEIEYYEGTEIKAARWFNDYGQFCITCDDKSVMTEEDFVSIIEELKEVSEISHVVTEYDLLAGSYYDCISQRAFADITSSGDSVMIDIYWANSALELTRYTMTAVYEGEDSLFYKNMQTSVITFADENDEEGTEVIQSNGLSGYFTVKDDGIHWDGSMNELTQDCVFVLENE